MNLQELPHADRQREALPPRRVAQASLELASWIVTRESVSGTSSPDEVVTVPSAPSRASRNGRPLRGRRSRWLRMMSRNASSRVWIPPSAVCASISMMRYGFVPSFDASIDCVNESIVQEKLLT